MKLLFLALALQLLSYPILSYNIIEEDIASLPPEYRTAAKKFALFTRNSVEYYDPDTYLKTDAFCELDPEDVSNTIQLALPPSHTTLAWRQSGAIRVIRIVDVKNNDTSFMSISKMNPAKPSTRKKVSRSNEATSDFTKPISLKIWLFRVHGDSKVRQKKPRIVKAFVWCKTGIDSDNTSSEYVDQGYLPNPDFYCCTESSTLGIQPANSVQSSDPLMDKLNKMSQPQTEKPSPTLSTEGKENSDTLNLDDETALDLFVASFLV